MANKKSTGAFVKDAINEQFLERGIDEIYTVRLSRTIEIDGENKNIHATLTVGHTSFKKLISMFNPKRVVWQIWEAPSAEQKEKYGDKAFGRYVDFDTEQLRLNK